MSFIASLFTRHAQPREALPASPQPGLYCFRVTADVGIEDTPDVLYEDLLVTLFATSIASANDELPAAVWRKVLRQHHGAVRIAWVELAIVHLAEAPAVVPAAI